MLVDRVEGLSIDVVGICGNRRMLDTENYIKTVTEETLCTPVRAIIGATDNQLQVTELVSPILDSAIALNSFQRQVVDLTRLRSSQVIIGPPGTGKSRTIVSFVLQILAEMEPNHIVIFTSEKNGAVEAVAQHLRNACVSSDGKVEDLAFFEMIAAFGSTGMQAATCSFTAKTKMDIHPEIVAKSGAASDLELKLNALKKSVAIAVYRTVVDVIDEAFNREDDNDLLLQLKRTYQSSSDLNGLKRAFGELLTRSSSPITAEAASALRRAVSVIGQNCPSLIEAEEAYTLAIEAKEATRQLVGQRMRACSRVILATIGSMHRVHSAVSAGNGIRDDDDEGYCMQGSLKFHFIIDEASTVPQFEICSLGQIGDVRTLTVFGDPEQLEPFTPHSRKAVARPAFGVLTRTPAPAVAPSIFKVDKVGRHFLELQYRIPRLIAKILDKHTYDGRYKSDASLPFNAHPVLLVHVSTPASAGGGRTPASAGGGRESILAYSLLGGVRPGGRGGRGRGKGPADRDRSGYKNEAEAAMVLKILAELRTKDVMVLTPYRDQVREIKYLHKTRVGNTTALDDKVITVDGSQGQEAEIVVISMTNSKPTKFMDSHRLTVMLSRAKKGIVLICDVPALKAACVGSDGLVVLKECVEVGTADKTATKWYV